MTSYKDELLKAMDLLSENPNTIFIGQTVVYGGTSMFHTLQNVPMNKRIELPVFEDVQMGMSIGLALEGFIPISIYPRFDFLICATNQIINHLDRINIMSVGRFNPFIIIRTSVGSVNPLFPGEQHNGNYTEAFKKMCKYIKVYELKTAEEIVPTYKKILEEKIPAIVIEYPDLYNSELEDKFIEYREGKNEIKMRWLW